MNLYPPLPFWLLDVRNGLSGVSTRLRLRFRRCLNREYYEFLPRSNDQRGNRLNCVFDHAIRECFRDTVTLYFEPTNASPQSTIEQNAFPIVSKMNRVKATNILDRQMNGGIYRRSWSTFMNIVQVRIVANGSNYRSTFSIGQLFFFQREQSEEKGCATTGIPLRRGAKLSELIRAILRANTSLCSQRCRCWAPGIESNKTALPSIITPAERKKKIKLRVRLCFNSRLRM